MAETPSRPSKSLEKLLAELDDVQDVESAFVEQILVGAATRDPALPQILQDGAIPQALDAEIIGVLRGDAADTEENKRYLNLISEYRFVHPRQNGGFVYHDNTRDALLTRWRSDEIKLARFTELNHALALHFENRYTESARVGQRLDEARGIIKQANPQRLVRLARAIDARMTSFLLSALYHHLMTSTQGGVDFFRETFLILEMSGRLSICQSLLSFAHDFLRRVTDEVAPDLLAWLDYFDARLARAMQPNDQSRAERILRTIVDDEELSDHLRTWSLDELAMICESKLELDEARRLYLELTERKVGVDPYNDPLRNCNLGALYWRLTDYEAAARQFERAIEKVESASDARKDIGILCHLHLSGVHVELGNWNGAFEVATEGLYLARTSFPDNELIQQQVADRFAQLLSTYDPRASDCAAAESIAMVVGQPASRLSAALNHINMLYETNRTRTARVRMDDVTAELEEASRETWFRWDVAWCHAELLQREGREADANHLLSALVDETADQPESRRMHINALGNRGKNRATLGDIDGSIEDLTAEVEQLLRFGFTRHGAAGKVELAQVRRKEGQRDEARALLTAADRELPSNAHNRAIWHSVSAKLSEDYGDWRGAQHHYEQALRIFVSLRAFTDEADISRKLAMVRAKLAEWVAAAEYDRRAGVAASRLAALDSPRDTDDTRRADLADIEGMRNFCRPQNRSTALSRARQLFQSASERDPDNVWLHLNLCFTFAEQRDWSGATGALTRVLALCPAPMRTRRLFLCLRDYALEHARTLHRSGDLSAANGLISGMLDHLVDELPEADLASLRITLLALILSGAGNPAAAVQTAAAVAHSVGPDGIAEGIVQEIHHVAHYWVVDTRLRAWTDQENPLLRDAAAAAQTRLPYRLDELLGLSDAGTSVEIPLIPSVAVEVGDRLVPLVDPRQDNGVFIDHLIPAMRRRVQADMGVELSGVRMRTSYNVELNEYKVLISEVPTSAGTVDPATHYVVTAANNAMAHPAGDLTDVHPLTGEPGLWVIREGSPGSDGGSTALTAPQCLLHRIEMVLRRNLDRFLGPEETARYFDQWAAEDDTGLVASVLPDTRARLRVTWVLQALVAESVPITNWRGLLRAVHDAGGASVSLDTLLSRVRRCLGTQLPGARTGRRIVRVPIEFEKAWGLQGGLANTDSATTRHAFLTWLRQEIASDGPAVALVTAAEESRRSVSTLARIESPLITVLSENELAEK